MRRPDPNSASIRLPPIEGLNDDLRQYMERTRERFGLDFDPTMARVLTTIPEIWRGEAHASKIAWSPGRLDVAAKEMIATCVSAMNACDY